MSRYTFREKCPEICYQKQVRDKYLLDPAPINENEIDLKSATVEEVSRKFAKNIIAKYEWLGTMHVNSSRHYGIFIKTFCAGVACFSNMGNSLHGIPNMFKLDQKECTYLSRGACVHWAPKGTNSKLISYALRLEGKKGKKIAIAFADTDAGEIGTVYQATNWVFTGCGQSSYQYVSPQGKLYTNNAITTLCKKHRIKPSELERWFKRNGWKRQMANKKYRYVYVIDKKNSRLHEVVESMRKPFPKREDEKDKSGSILNGKIMASQVKDGGSSPTLPLHEIPS